MRSILTTTRSIYVVLAIFSGFNAELKAQQPLIEWQRPLGGLDNEEGSSVRPLSGGGYMVCGYTSSNDGDVSNNHGSSDCWIALLDDGGTLTWQHAFGGSSSEGGQAAEQTSDGGYILAGYTRSNDGDVSGHHGPPGTEDIWVVKLSAVGALEWQRALGGTSLDIATAVEQTSDGGYIVVGETHSTDGDVIGQHGANDAWAVKLDASGTIEWQRACGGSLNDAGQDIHQTSDGGYILTGMTWSNDGDVSGQHGFQTDLWVVKLDAAGDLIWQHAYGGTDREFGESIQETADGGFIIAGRSLSYNGDVAINQGAFDGWLLRIDNMGAIQWERSLGGGDDDRFFAAHELADGSFVAAGYTISDDGDVVGEHGWIDAWFVKLDPSGTLLYQLPLGGTATDRVNDMRPTVDGGYVLTGYTDSNDGDVSGLHGEGDLWVVKLGPDQVDVKETEALQFSMGPNPCSGVLHLTMDRPVPGSSAMVMNTLGEMMLDQPITATEQTLDLRHLPTGAYIVRLSAGGMVRSRRLVVL